MKMLHSYPINVVFCIVVGAFAYPNILQQFFSLETKRKKKKQWRRNYCGLPKLPLFSGTFIKASTDSIGKFVRYLFLGWNLLWNSPVDLWIFRMSLKGRPFNVWGAGSGWFRKKSSFKRLSCCNHENKSYTAVRKKKKCCKAISLLKFIIWLVLVADITRALIG